MRIRSPFKNLFPTRRTKRTKKSRAALKAACLSLGLATAWGASDAEAVPIQLDVTPSEELTSAYAIFHFFDNGSFIDQILQPLGTVPAGQTSQYNYNFENYDESQALHSFAGYSVIGVYDESGEDGVAVAFPDDGPIQAGNVWEDIFTFVTLSETAVISDLQTPDESDLRNFFNVYDNEVITPFNVESTIVLFSEAAAGGTAIARIVPEPATFSLLVLSTGIIALGRRRGR